ncbi:MAG: M20 family metallo-hydrolase [Deltaproteobacteria bacterium]|nr:M20 family metallo-hydrolase [Deltaproteobacteria bacterium]
MKMEKIFQKIEAYGDEIIDFQRELTSKIALGPANGGTGEHEKALYLKEKLQDLNPYRLEMINAPDPGAREGFRPNIVAQWKGKFHGPTVWILCHMDIVPPGDLSLWESDPYILRLDGDRIIGRGVEDNQHGIVSSYLALKGIRDAGFDPELPIGLVYVADEETGSEFGLEYLLRNHMDLFKKEDLIIVPDGGNEKGTMIEVAEKSMLWLKFTVNGRQCHASIPDKGKNSLYGIARLIIALDELKDKYNLTDDLFSPRQSTFEPTKIEANVPNINTIPGRDVFYLDCRILPVYAVDEIYGTASGIAKDLEKQLGLSIDITTVYRLDAVNPTSVDAAIVKTLAGAIKEVKGLEAKPMGIGGGTVAAFFRQAGLPAAVWMTTHDTAHQPNEYTLISDIITDAKIFACVYMNRY